MLVIGLVGLAISYALSITGLLQGMVQTFTTTEQDMVSMERAQQYIDDVPKEKTQALLQVGQQHQIIQSVKDHFPTDLHFRYK